VEQVAAVRDPRHFELTLRDQSTEQCGERGRPELVAKDPHVGLVASVELAGANPAHRALDRQRLLLFGKVVDVSVQNARELFPFVSWNVAEGAHEAMTVSAGPDTKAYRRPRATRRASSAKRPSVRRAGPSRRS
jgi:hypothetical protein